MAGKVGMVIELYEEEFKILCGTAEQMGLRGERLVEAVVRLWLIDDQVRRLERETNAEVQEEGSDGDR